MRKTPVQVAVVILCVSLCGCGHAPEFNILGSYFPAWMLCMFVGIIAAVLVRLIVNRFKLVDYARPTTVTYPSIALFATFITWLAFFY